MQAITIAIGKAGVVFFTEQLVAKELISTLSTMQAPERDIHIDRIVIEFSHADNINIKLTEGKLNGFKPDFKSVSQQTGGNFTLQLAAGNFSAAYKWVENYDYTYCTFDPETGRSCLPVEHVEHPYPYAPSFGPLNVTVPVKFEYNTTKKEWDVVAGTSTSNVPTAQANIPGDSIIQNEDPGCFTTHVSDATATAISTIDFGTKISQVIQGVVASIPASGDLGSGIKYDFSLGEDELKFPGDDGIQMGVRGGASYNGTDFPGSGTPPKLPLPPALADSDRHHLNMYVSNYEVDALNWAYFKAGKLNKTVNPGDTDIIKDPDVLKVKTYVAVEPPLKPYEAFGMQAQISPVDAPVTHFQTVWEFPTDPVMNKLKTLLPADVYDLLSGIEGDAFISETEVKNFLTEATVPSQYFTTITDTSKRMGMVVNSNLNFTLIVLGKEKPDIKFSVLRTDILSNLRLGIGTNNTQTMQYDFVKVAFAAKFVSSTVPGFIGGDYFTQQVWVHAGEPGYDSVMSNLGKAGVPLPIMADFKFDFTNAELSVQQGFVSILANVQYKGTLR